MRATFPHAVFLCFLQEMKRVQSEGLDLFQVEPVRQMPHRAGLKIERIGNTVRWRYVRSKYRIPTMTAFSAGINH